jgi:hypothetical protein
MLASASMPAITTSPSSLPLMSRAIASRTPHRARDRRGRSRHCGAAGPSPYPARPGPRRCSPRLTIAP